jgi:hypothetical protein
MAPGMAFAVVGAFLFYAFFVWKFLVSLLRTVMRLWMAIWSQDFGAGEEEFFILRWVDGGARWFARMSSGDEDSHASCTDRFKAFFLFGLAVTVFGVPLFYIAIGYGYWAVMNVLCVLVTIGTWLLKGVRG